MHEFRTSSRQNPRDFFSIQCSLSWLSVSWGTGCKFDSHNASEVLAGFTLWHVVYSTVDWATWWITWWSSYSKIKSPAKKTIQFHIKYQFWSLKMSKKIYFNLVNKFVSVIISHSKLTKTSLFVITIFLRYPTINDIHTRF